MTYRALFKQISAQLEGAGCDSPAFDTGCLFSRLADIQQGMLPLYGGVEVPQNILHELENAAHQRAKGRPLQYILGEWDFLSLTLEVWEGVLIPRADTELLCEKAAERLAGIANPRVLDLCAGSGCVGLGVASLCRGVNVTAVELSEQAMIYMQRNCARYPDLDVTTVKADVLNDADRFDGVYDAILSNPPYIPTKDLPSLMREVRREPEMALDGGDGLVFYRAIAHDWLPKIGDGGFCAVEIGIGQAEDVSEIFKASGLKEIEVFRDLGGIERVVTGKK